uniref:Translation initiation factor beta propellor-like domain-containing protein n=1 Tax=Ciona savignyi TaxID=51511 RepID=H2ZFM9_CIOSA
LQHVLGLTVKSNCSLSCDPNTGLLAYPAGCVIVLYNPRNGKQTPIHNPGNKNITCLRFSCDGTHIATGESGHQPCVRVFSVADRSQLIAFDSHKYGISCVTFSPNMKYVVSVGFQHDQVINVWDWKNNSLAASNKVSTKIKSVAFSHNNNYFVTVGNRHVKFWYMEPTPDKCTLPIKGRSAILESYRNQLYCDVTCGLGSDDDLTFAITRSGVLCQFNARRTVEKSIQLKVRHCDTLTTIPDMVVCGGSSGSILVFSSSSLLPLHILPPPGTIRLNFCSTFVWLVLTSRICVSTTPEILANTIDIRSMWMHTIFADHSLLVYDIMDFSSPQTHALSTFHSSSVWDIKVKY